MQSESDGNQKASKQQRGKDGARTSSPCDRRRCSALRRPHLRIAATSADAAPRARPSSALGRTGRAHLVLSDLQPGALRLEQVADRLVVDLQVGRAHLRHSPRTLQHAACSPSKQSRAGRHARIGGKGGQQTAEGAATEARQLGRCVSRAEGSARVALTRKRMPGAASVSASMCAKTSAMAAHGRPAAHGRRARTDSSARGYALTTRSHVCARARAQCKVWEISRADP
eukprot:668276-Pleurochrysis_carterae.AAC.15